MAVLTKVPVNDAWRMVCATDTLGMFDWSRFNEKRTALWVTLPMGETGLVRDPDTGRITGISYDLVTARDYCYPNTGTQRHATAHIRKVLEAIARSVPVYGFYVSGAHGKDKLFHVESADMSRLFVANKLVRTNRMHMGVPFAEVSAVFVPFNKTIQEIQNESE